MNAHVSRFTSHAPLDWRSVARAVAGQTVGCDVRYLQVTGSTNDDVRRLAEQGASEGTVVLADAQTAGRGRAGKSPWLTPPRTSIALSILLHPHLPPEQLGRLSMAAGVAAIDAVEAATALRPALKWPNDVVAGGRKLGGILVESVIRGGSVACVIAGIGLNGNLRASDLGPLPDAAVAPTSLLEELGAPVGREAIVIALLRAFDSAYAALRRGEFEAIWERYRSALTTLNAHVRIREATAEADAIEGVAVDLTRDGALIVRLPSGERRIFGHGEVSVRMRRET
ncbi:MAG: biotin--[acetyl-CoA-carboxylase] ligase [Chloroflexi bacterium]|nr:biotin--[acetyl-CoA-carboxylase] ligase [Chloroflexota bacterium]